MGKENNTNSMLEV